MTTLWCWHVTLHSAVIKTKLDTFWEEDNDDEKRNLCRRGSTYTRPPGHRGARAVNNRGTQLCSLYSPPNLVANDSFECDGNNLNTIEKNVSGWSTSTIQSPNGLTVGETSTFDLGLRNRSGYLAFCNPQPQTERARSFPTRGRQHHRERLNNDRHDPGTARPHRIHVQQRRDTPRLPEHRRTDHLAPGATRQVRERAHRHLRQHDGAGHRQLQPAA